MFRTVRQISLGIVRDAGSRRMAMGTSLATAAALLFAGSTLLVGWLGSHPVCFILWWAACGWLTLLAILLAVFDLLILRRTARASRRELLRQMARDFPAPERPQPDAPAARSEVTPGKSRPS